MRCVSPRALLFWSGAWCLALAGLLWLASGVDWPRVRATVSATDPCWIAAATAINLLGLPFWFGAWRLIAPRSPRPDARALVEAQLIFLAGLQTLSALGAGLAVYFGLVRRAGLNWSGALSLVACDNLITSSAKLIILGVAFILVPTPPALRGAAFALFVATIAALFTLRLVIKYGGRLSVHEGSGWRATARRFCRQLAIDLEPIRDRRRFILAVGLIVIRRFSEAGAAICVQIACGLAPSAEMALLVVALLAIATSLPGPPGNFGLFETAVTLAYVAMGVDDSTAIAMALLHHLASLFAAVLPGYVVLFLAMVAPSREGGDSAPRYSAGTGCASGRTTRE